jgi:hypothetical protein
VITCGLSQQIPELRFQGDQFLESWDVIGLDAGNLDLGDVRQAYEPYAVDQAWLILCLVQSRQIRL